MTPTHKTITGLILAMTLVLAGALSSVNPAHADDGPEDDVSQSGEIVVKVDTAGGHTIGEVATGFPIEVINAMLASRGIYLVRATEPVVQQDDQELEDLAKQIAQSTATIYAEPDRKIDGEWAGDGGV